MNTLEVQITFKMRHVLVLLNAHTLASLLTLCNTSITIIWLCPFKAVQNIPTPHKRFNDVTMLSCYEDAAWYLLFWQDMSIHQHKINQSFIECIRAPHSSDLLLLDHHIIVALVSSSAGGCKVELMIISPKFHNPVMAFIPEEFLLTPLTHDSWLMTMYRYCLCSVITHRQQLFVEALRTTQRTTRPTPAMTDEQGVEISLPQ